MATLLALKRRIRAASSVSKTTRAMQMIAVSKLKKAQDATLSGRPYVEKLSAITQNVLSKLEETFTHPYMQKNEIKKNLVLVVSPDKGLCGGLVSNLIRKLINFDSQNKDSIYITVGKKTEKIVVSLNNQLIASFKFGTTLPSFDVVLPITKVIDEYFLSSKVGSFKIISTNFLTVFSQKPEITNILPIEFPKPASPPASPDRGEQGGDALSNTYTLFEPQPSKLLPHLLKHLLEMKVYQVLLESFASEQGARMVAMQNATDNALEIVQDLKLEYNKERQEKITNEILDIGGATFTYSYE